jgi:6-phosphogluconolactonase
MISDSIASSPKDIVYVSLRGGNAILIYNLDNTTGKINLRKSLPCEGGPASMTFSGNHKYLYVSERESNSFSAYRVDEKTGDLKFINRIKAVDNPVNLEVDKSGRFLLTVYYHSGQAAVYGINKDGSLMDSVLQVIPGFVNPHAIHLNQKNNLAFITDKGGDKIYCYTFNSSSGILTENKDANVVTPKGTEPRHFILDENHRKMYVINEGGNSVTVYNLRFKTGILTKLQELSTLPEGVKVDSKCADIHVSHDGKFLYASNRGHNSIAVFQIDKKSRLLHATGIFSTISKPRSFAFNSTGKYLIASDEAGTQIAIHKVDQSNGTLSTMKKITVGEQPFWVLTLPLK